MTQRKLNPPELPAPTGYSQVVVASGSRMVFVAGQVALDREGAPVAQPHFLVEVEAVAVIN